jgi:hypothetical protein
MKVIGNTNKLGYWERFNRLQRRANLLRKNGACKKGIYKFSNYSEIENHKSNHLNTQEHPKKTI